MQEDIDQEPSAHSPAAVLAAGIVAAMSFAIVFNTAWNQPDDALARLRGMAGDVIEINAGEAGPDRGRASAAGTHVIVAGERQPQDASPPGGLLLQVQLGLEALGYFTGAADGIDGELTRKAVRRYQARNGLRPDGKINRELLDRIRYTRQLIAATRFPAPAENQKPDERVVLVQTGLAELGYRPGAVDGFLGEATRRAIREFESQRGLPQTGEISSRLIAEMKKISGISKFANP